MSKPSLNIIGAGRVGQTIGKLFNINGCFEIRGILNKTNESSKKAIEFIGSGYACDTLSDLPNSDVLMITTPDFEIENIAKKLSESDTVKTKVVFHCSGATASTALNSLAKKGINIGSIHPIMTFATPEKSINDFSGVYCGFEGEDVVLDTLRDSFEKIGGKIFRINTEKKAIYHAATTMACNYLIALMDTAIDLYVESGLKREEALSIMQPIVKKTIDNIFSIEPIKALTGPIARGDYKTVQRHMDVLTDKK
jgi:predicted short-subunit dehydrogenase-like oxidoreductase (DUF2520 family)